MRPAGGAVVTAHASQQLAPVERSPCAGSCRWLGVAPMGIVYLLLPLPVFFAWGRWVLEREAYLAGMLHLRKHGVTPDNARELMSQPDVDGARVGGASLDVRNFSGIILNSI